MGCSNSSVSLVAPISHQPLQVVTPADNPSFCLRIPGRGELPFAVKYSGASQGTGALRSSRPDDGPCQPNPQDGSIVLAADQKRELLGIGTMTLTDSLLQPVLFSAGSILQHPTADSSKIPLIGGCSAGQLGNTRRVDGVPDKERVNQIVSGTVLLGDSAALAEFNESQQYRFPNQTSVNIGKKEAGLSPIRIKHLKPRMSARHILHNEASDGSNPRSRHNSNALEPDPCSPQMSAKYREAISNPNILSRLRKLSDGLKPEEQNISERGTVSASRVLLSSSVRKPSDDSGNRVLLGYKKKVRGLSFSITSRATPERKNSSLRGRYEMSAAKQPKSELVDPKICAETFGVSACNKTPRVDEVRKPELTGHQRAPNVYKGADPQQPERPLASSYSQSATGVIPRKNFGNSDRFLEVKVLQKSKFSQLTTHLRKQSEKLDPDSIKSQRQPVKPSSWPHTQAKNFGQPLNIRITGLQGATRDEASSNKSDSSQDSGHNSKGGSDDMCIADAASPDPKDLPLNTRIGVKTSETFGLKKMDSSFHKKLLFKLTNKPQQTDRTPLVSPQVRKDAYSETSHSAEENKLPTFSIKPLDCNADRENYSQLSASSDENLL